MQKGGGGGGGGKVAHSEAYMLELILSIMAFFVCSIVRKEGEGRGEGGDE